LGCPFLLEDTVFGYSWPTWILYAPQYHALMLFLCLIVIALLVRITRQLKARERGFHTVDVQVS
jgi:hypothetical protein